MENMNGGKVKTINRKELINVIENVKPGLTQSNTVDLSEFIHFGEEEVLSFSDNICVSASYITGIKGSVKGDQLLEILKKLDDDELKVKMEKNKLIISQKKKKKEIKISMAVADSNPDIWPEIPDKWKKIPDDFIKGVESTIFAASKDPSLGALAGIYIEKDSVLGCDNHCLAVFKLKKKIDEPLLIPIQAAKFLVNYPVVEYAQNDNWIHFSTSDSTIFSCRKIDGEYPSGVWDLLKIKGKPIVFPERFRETLERSQVFQAEDNQVKFYIATDKITCISQSETGEIEEKSPLDYKGVPFIFKVNSDLIKQIIDQTDKAVLGENSLLFETDDFKYVVALVSNE